MVCKSVHLLHLEPIPGFEDRLDPGEEERPVGDGEDEHAEEDVVEICFVHRVRGRGGEEVFKRAADEFDIRGLGCDVRDG